MLKSEEAGKDVLRERDKLRRWDHSWGSQTWLIANWPRKTNNSLEQIDIRLMCDHLALFQHVYRDWNGEADCLTHKAR